VVRQAEREARPAAEASPFPLDSPAAPAPPAAHDRRAAAPRGLGRNAANYGDRDFALYLRRSFAKSMGYSQAMLDRPVVGIADTGSDFNNCHRTRPELVER
jgi:dihydroxyacid dehydratase/phosphogluconate dehydratase